MVSLAEELNELLKKNKNDPSAFDKEEINKEISALEQIHATGIETVANKQYKSYLKDTGLGKIFKEYEAAEEKWNKVRDRMQNICKALHEKTD